MIANAIAWVISHYITFILYYVGIGLTYTFIKWVVLLLKLRRKVLSLNSESKDFEMNRLYCSRAIFGNNSSYPPTAYDNIGNLTMWAMCWPINLPWTLFHDVLNEIFNFVYRKIGAIYNAIALAILPK